MTMVVTGMCGMSPGSGTGKSSEITASIFRAYFGRFRLNPYWKRLEVTGIYQEFLGGAA